MIRLLLSFLPPTQSIGLHSKTGAYSRYLQAPKYGHHCREKVSVDFWCANLKKKRKEKKGVFAVSTRKVLHVFSKLTFIFVSFFPFLLNVNCSFMANTVVWMNKLQSDLAKLAEREEEEDEQLDIEVPPFKPVLKKSVVGVGRDFSIQILRRIYEILACSVVEPKLGCKLLKNVHSSAIRKRLRYFFAGVPLKQRLQIAGTNVQKMTLTCFRSSCLGYLAEMTVRELIILYRTWIWETINFEEDREYDGVSHLDYFQYHTFWNLVKISTRLSLTSLGVGLSSLMSTQPEYWPAAGKLPTMTGFMLGDLAGATLVTYLELKFRPQTYWDIIEPDED